MSFLHPFHQIPNSNSERSSKFKLFLEEANLSDKLNEPVQQTKIQLDKSLDLQKDLQGLAELGKYPYKPQKELIKPKHRHSLA